MPYLRISAAAALLGVSDDTVRRMADSGRLATAKDSAGRLTVSGTDLAALAREIAHPAPVGSVTEESARNRMRGIVTRVVRDTVMAQVEMQAVYVALESDPPAAIALSLVMLLVSIVILGLLRGRWMR